jgi:hypothetical protein
MGPEMFVTLLSKLSSGRLSRGTHGTKVLDIEWNALWSESTTRTIVGGAGLGKTDQVVTRTSAIPRSLELQEWLP